MRFSRSTHLLMYLSLETLTSIIRTDLPILVGLIDLGNSFIIFLSQTTVFKWLTFLLGSQTVRLDPRLPDSHGPALLHLFFSSEASIWSTMVFPPLGNFVHVVVSVSIDFPSYSQQDVPFHCIAYDYYRAD